MPRAGLWEHELAKDKGFYSRGGKQDSVVPTPLENETKNSKNSGFRKLISVGVW
jgi:hypothetical protein